MPRRKKWLHSTQAFNTIYVPLFTYCHRNFLVPFVTFIYQNNILRGSRYSQSYLLCTSVLRYICYVCIVFFSVGLRSILTAHQSYWNIVVAGNRDGTKGSSQLSPPSLIYQSHSQNIDPIYNLANL